MNISDIDPRFNMGGSEDIKRGKQEHLSHLLSGADPMFTPPKGVFGRAKAVFKHLKAVGYFYTCQHCGWWCEALHWSGDGEDDLWVCEICAEAIHNKETLEEEKNER